MTAPRKRAPAKRTAKAAAPRQSQRDRLLGRPRPSLPYRLLVDPDAAELARAQLAEVHAQTRQTLIREKDGSPAHRAATKRRGDAEAAVDACYETLMLQALPPARVEALEAAHPPTPEQVAKVKAERERAQQRGDPLPDWPSWNDDTYRPALLAESAPGAGMSVDDWARFLAEHVSDGEARALMLAAIQVNQQERVADPLVLPKGWTPTISSL